ncbi:anti-sigma factor [Microbacterium sp.]|uniref:anti-sigma factor n=1 Tax=Microbacterium sp. TaxID=51671 RepID=UPI0039E330AB
MAEEPEPADEATPAREAAREPASEGPPSTDVIQTIQRRNWTRGVIAVVGAIVVLVGIGWGAGAIANSLAPPVAAQLLEQIRESADAESATAIDGPTASLHWSDSLGQVVFTASGLPELDEGEQFEAWYVRGKAVFSAGTFTSTAGAATVSLNSAFRPGDTVEVTVEKRGGTSTGPTSDAVIRIPTD